MIKKLKMKNLNLLFAAALILLMYRTPAFLTDISTSIFGRAALVIVLAYTLIYCEFSCAVFFALIIIVLFHNTLEGFKEGEGEGGLMAQLTKDNPETEPPEDDEKDEEDEKDEDEKDEDEKDEKDEKDEEEFSGKEGFLGFNMISKKAFNKNILGDLRNTMKHNLTDFDRFLKTNSEKNTIASTKQ